VCIRLSLLGKGSVNTFPWQRIIVGDVVFYVVSVVSKESKRLVLPISFCFIRDFCFERITIFDEVRIWLWHPVSERMRLGINGLNIWKWGLVTRMSNF
jgi:hypothetical protein